MTAHFRRPWLAAILLLANFPAAVQANDTLYRPGDQVVVIADAKLRVSGRQEVDEVWPGLVLKVEATQGSWLWLGQGKSGWLAQKHVRPLDRSAIDHLTRLIQARPQSANLYSGRSEVWAALGELDISIADLGEAIRLSPTSAAFYNNRGNRLKAKGEYDKAISDYNEALRLDPKYDSAYNGRGNCWKNKGEYDRAIQDYNESLRIEPRSAMVYNNRGIAWSDKGEHDKAIQDYDQALRLNPKYSIAFNNRGVAWERMGDYHKAIQDYTAALEIDPKSQRYFHNRGDVRRYAGDYANAVVDFSQAIRLEPKSSDDFKNRGYARLMLAEFDKAIADQTEAIRLAPKDFSGHLGRGISHLLQRDAAASADFQAVIDLQGDSGSHTAYAILLGALAARMEGDATQAAKFLNQARREKASEWPWPCVAYVRGELDENALVALSDTNDKRTEAVCYVALTALAAGNPARARELFTWVAQHGNRTYIEHVIAHVELQRLAP